MIYENRIITVEHGKEDYYIQTRIVTSLLLLEKYGAKVVGGIYKTVSGRDACCLSFMLGFERLAHREKVFNEIYEDADFQKLNQWWAKDGCFTKHIHNEILSSTEYVADSGEIPRFDENGDLIRD